MTNSVRQVDLDTVNLLSYPRVKPNILVFIVSNNLCKSQVYISCSRELSVMEAHVKTLRHKHTFNGNYYPLLSRADED